MTLSREIDGARVALGKPAERRAGEAASQLNEPHFTASASLIALL
jgi:hypothetical protein